MVFNLYCNTPYKKKGNGKQGFQTAGFFSLRASQSSSLKVVVVVVVVVVLVLVLVIFCKNL